MQNEVEELGAYVLKILEKMKKTETKIKKLEESVADINKLIAEATEEMEATEETAPQGTQLTPLRLWAPLNIGKWIAVVSAVFYIATLRARMSLVEWNQVFPADWSFWMTIEYIIVGVSLAAVVGIEFFLYWRQRRSMHSSNEPKPEKMKGREVTEDAEPETEAKAITEETPTEPAETLKTPKTKERAR